MTTDLERALGGLASAAESAARPVPVDRVLTRLHRRRAARTAVTTAAGVTTAGAVALGGATLAQTQRTAPPVTSPSPTTSPEAPAWSAVAASGAFACGAPVPAVDDPAGDADLHLETTASAAPTAPGAAPAWGPRSLDGVTIAPGEALLLDTVLVNGTGTDVGAAVPRKPRVTAWLVQDGVVVGELSETITAEDGPAWVPLDVPAGASAPVPSGQMTPFACDGESGAALPAGPYDLYLALPVAPPTAADDPGQVESTSTVVGGPYAVTVAGPAAPEAPETEEPAQGPPALDELVLTHAGLGPLAIGSEVPYVPSPTDLVRFDAAACAGTDLPERWVAAYPDGIMANGAPSAPFTVSPFEGRLTRIDVLTPGPRTSGGIGVGSALDELRAAHPEMTLLRAAAETGEAVDAWGVEVDGRTLAVEVASNAGTGGWAADQADRVVALTLVSGIPYASPAWGGDTCG
ncbi:hypothetical protein [Actinotalea solisilvae]|uniref:hypothetical protein n=1 Tax=Actinotalea solisilvae TaxID=2072922 RepID=UPI0018F16FD1|nr:hypothetical protein [Actinotalea solisilvae]